MGSTATVPYPGANVTEHPKRFVGNSLNLSPGLAGGKKIPCRLTLNPITMWRDEFSSIRLKDEKNG